MSHIIKKVFIKSTEKDDDILINSSKEIISILEGKKDKKDGVNNFLLLVKDTDRDKFVLTKCIKDEQIKKYISTMLLICVDLLNKQINSKFFRENKDINVLYLEELYSGVISKFQDVMLSVDQEKYRRDKNES